MVSLISAPVPIIVTGMPASDSMFSMNLVASFVSFEYSLIPLHSGKMMSNFVSAIWVALLIRMDFFARLKSKGAALLSLPVTLPNSNQFFSLALQYLFHLLTDLLPLS